MERDNSTVLHRLYLWATDQPTEPALHFKSPEGGWQSVSSSAYWQQVARIGIGLRQSGLVPGDRIVIYSLNSPDWVQWELGAWLAGVVSVGIHPNLPDSDIRSILNLSKPKYVLVESELFRERIKRFRPEAENVCLFTEARDEILKEVSFDDPIIRPRAEALLKNVNPNDTCMVIYTSGTTGRPKGVKLGLRQITFVSDVLSREWNLPYMDGHLFSFLPLSHVAEKIQSVGVAITQRYPVWFNSNYDRLVPELREVRPTLLLAVPRVWEKFKEQIELQKPKLLQRVMEIERVGAFAERVYLSQAREQLGLDRLKLAVSGAVKLAPTVADWFLNIGIEIQEIYGMSESCGLVTLTHPKRNDFKTVGVPASGIEVRITEEGEIWVKGPNVFFGYDQDEAETQAILLDDGWMKTGDLGEWSPELQIIGRNREIIKLSNGRMIAPLPIENALKEIPEISNVCLVGEGRHYLLAIITLKEDLLLEYKFVPGAIEGLAVEDDKLRERIQTQINSLVEQSKIHEKIGRFVILSREFLVEKGELTPTQKLNRSQIQKNFRHFIDLRFED